MNPGSSGRVVIAWSQTETDGVRAAPLDMLLEGVTWRWTGPAVRLDGLTEMLRLQGSEAVAQVRRRAARVVRKLVGDLARPKVAHPGLADPACPGFILTDGHATYPMTVLATPDSGALLILAEEDMPPADQELWVVHAAIDRRQIAPRPEAGVICFTPGTHILTPQGARRIEDLRPGNLVFTRDNGAQAVLWTGSRHISAARLHLMPHLRPIRLRSHALGQGRPDLDLLVSPQHRMLVRGRAAQALFNVDEVLVKAEDMVNDRTIVVDHAARDIRYIHVLLERHSVIWANGLETESFHPANAAPDAMDAAQRGGLLAVLPTLDQNPHVYGDFARRNLTSFEAAVLRHDMPSVGC